MDFDDAFKTFPTIETDRLRLRELVYGDAKDILNYYSDDGVTKFLDINSISKLTMAEDFIYNMRDGFNEKKLIRWAISLKEKNTLIGTCYLSRLSNNLEGDLGYDLSKPYWRKGIMTEAAEAVLAFGFEELGLSKIHAGSNPLNTASIALLNKLGFKEEGLNITYDQKYDDKNLNHLNMYTMTRDEYLSKKGIG